MRIIANPSSNSEKGKKRWKYWKQKLKEKIMHFDFLTSKSKQDIINLASQSNEDIAVVGGDGTINACINGIMNSKYKNISLGVLYAGTSPDFCNFNSIPTNPKESFKTLVNNKKKKIDLVELCYINKENNKVYEYFACSCNIGAGAQVAKFANRWRKIFGDKLGTGFGVLKSILFLKNFKAELKIDDQDYIFNNVNHIIIIKNPYIASGLKLNLEVAPNDGKLYVLVINNKNRIQLLNILKDFYNGEIANRKDIFLKICKSISLKTNPNQMIEFDGDPYGKHAIDDIIHFKILTKKLSLIC
ncbi:MAG: hypothetical protein GY830_05945 [Bacteroidetes bacterium]|nr:hypothetical protein [Bacteroidota bacterium]